MSLSIKFPNFQQILSRFAPKPQKTQGCIDRFEGNFAVIELANGKMMDVPRNALPKNAKEGAWLDLSIKGTKVVGAQVNEALTAQKKAEIEQITKDIFEN